MTTMADAMEKSIAAALEDGLIDMEKHGPMVVALREMAVKVDEGSARASLFGTMLKYFDALNMLPPETGKEQSNQGAKVAKFARYSRAG